MTLLPGVLKALAERIDNLLTVVRANHNSAAENINDLRTRVTELERYLPHLRQAGAGDISPVPMRQFGINDAVALAEIGKDLSDGR